MKTKYFEKTNYNILFNIIYHKYQYFQFNGMDMGICPEGHIPMFKFIDLEIGFDLLLFRNL